MSDPTMMPLMVPSERHLICMAGEDIHLRQAQKLIKFGIASSAMTSLVYTVIKQSRILLTTD